MGFLKKGNALDWKSSKPHIKNIKESGVAQFIQIYHQHRSTETVQFRWGDEVEYIVLKRTENGLKVSHNGYKAIEKFAKLAENLNTKKLPCNLLPEYGSFMIESTPKSPYNGSICDLMLVERNMRLRRYLIESLLEQNEILMSISNFPRLGTKNYSFPDASVGGEFSESTYISDESINPHPRFRMLTRNIRQRRGSKVTITVPKYAENSNSKEQNTIEMDAMAFGMGCCCLQVTLQTQNMRHSRYLYDQLVILSPIFLALTASTPFHKGEISDWDVRWNIISQSVDCRNAAERGKSPLGFTEQLISKSRFSPVSSFLSVPEDDIKFNNLAPAMNRTCLQTLLNNGVDIQMARHIAHLFVRDPLVIYDNQIREENDGETDNTENFENIQSTNWQTCRLKPPSGDATGWRVEFRAMEVQLTDFENAAFSVFLVLLSRAILHFHASFYIPMDKVYENMAEAHRKDACRQGEFMFKATFGLCERETNSAAKNASILSQENCTLKNLSKETIAEENTSKKSIEEIVCGRGKFGGLVGLVRRYLDHVGCNPPFEKVLNRYLSFVELRARGELKTTAQWMRDFVTKNSTSEKSEINQKDSTLLLEEMWNISRGISKASDLLGEYQSIEKEEESARKEVKEAIKEENKERLEKLMERGVEYTDDCSLCTEI